MNKKKKIDHLLTKKIEDNVQVNDYKNLYDDYRSLDKQINSLIENDGYLKNEVYLVKKIDELKVAKRRYNKIKKEEVNREYIQNFTTTDIQNIKLLI